MKKILLVIIGITILINGCNDDDNAVAPATSALELNITGLEDLGSNAIYEGWIMVDGSPKTTGTFSVNSAGSLSETTFQINSDDLNSATAFILTIEPNPDPDPNPSNTHILAGDFNGSSASLSVGHNAALGNDFSSISGKYILATPTNGPDTDENNGIWFLDLASGSPAVGLDLPALPEGWKYEGWAVINGVAVTSGTFLTVDSADDSDPFSSTQPGPPFPGEDYLVNAPMDLTFPTNLAGGLAVISVEPDPDNSPNPFTLKPLLKMIPSDAADHLTYTMDKNLGSFPTGIAKK